MNTGAHLQHLEECFNELLPLSESTGAPASIQYQYIGTLVDNTLVMLSGVSNSLDGGTRSVQFPDKQNWISAMQAVHRSFYSSIIIATEIGLQELCDAKGIPVQIERQKAVKSLITKIENQSGDLSPRLQKAMKQLVGRHPDFMDYVRSALKASDIPSDKQVIWVNFFAGLVVVRNKVSHSNTSLSAHEKSLLEQGGFNALISPIGDLQINSRNYKQVIEYVLQFYDDLNAAK